MKIQTRNTLYTLEDLGDGAFTLQGHETYCPEPTKVTLGWKPEVDKYLMFIPVEGPFKGRSILTTRIKEITE